MKKDSFYERQYKKQESEANEKGERGKFLLMQIETYHTILFITFSSLLGASSAWILGFWLKSSADKLISITGIVFISLGALSLLSAGLLAIRLHFQRKKAKQAKEELLKMTQNTKQE